MPWMVCGAGMRNRSVWLYPVAPAPRRRPAAPGWFAGRDTSALMQAMRWPCPELWPTDPSSPISQGTKYASRCPKDDGRRQDATMPFRGRRQKHFRASSEAGVTCTVDRVPRRQPVVQGSLCLHSSGSNPGTLTCRRPCRDTH